MAQQTEAMEQPEASDVEAEGEPGGDRCGRGFLLGRLLFGGILTIAAIDNLRNLEAMIEYAKAKNAPQPEVTVPFGSTALLFGSLGIVFWRFPKLAITGVLTFLIPTTPVMHDFWNMDGEQREIEQIQFLKNLGLIGGALAFLAHTSDE